MKKLLLITIIFISFLSSCKPTEKGYKAAYDAAREKREATFGDIDVNLPEGALQDYDGAQLREINGVKVYILNQRISSADGTFTLPGSYNVAVGTYKMITNCRSQVATLLDEGYNAFAAKEPDGMYYTIAGSFDSLDEAVSFYEKYRTNPRHVYVGLPNAPIIIYSPK